jgi:hypothetical protein
MHLDLMSLLQLLTGQGRTLIGVMLLKQRQHFLLGLVRNPTVRGLSPSPAQNAPIPFLLNSFHQSSHLSRTQTRHFGRWILADLLIQGLLYEVLSLDLVRFHPQ